MVTESWEGHIAAPPAEVWAAIAQVSSWRHWVPHVLFVEAPGEGRIEPGLKVRFRTESASAEVSVEEATKNACARWKSSGGFESEIEIRIEAEGKGTRVVSKVSLPERWLAGTHASWMADALIKGLGERVHERASR